MASGPSRYQAWRKRVRRRWKHQPGWWPWLLSLPARGLLWTLRALPPYFALGLVERVGRLMWWVPKRRQVGLRHLARALPEASDAERARIGKMSCGLMARGVAETLLLGEHHEPQDMVDEIQMEPETRALFLAQKDGGAVFVQGHFGSMELTMGLLGALGLRLLTVMRRPNNYYIARALTEGREGWGVDLTSRDGALKRMRTRLREGGSVILAMDVNARRGGIFVPWFGVLAATEPAAAWLTLRTGRPLVVSWLLRADDRRQWRAGGKLVRSEHPPERKPSDESILALTTRIHEVLEAVIREHPEQYFWIHDRYRTRPPGEAADG